MITETLNGSETLSYGVQAKVQTQLYSKLYYLLTYYLYVDVKEPDWLQFEPADVWILEVTPSIQTQNGRFCFGPWTPG